MVRNYGIGGLVVRSDEEGELMQPYYQDLHNTLYNIDFRENDLPNESVQMVVTSPPYWGLRKYSGEQELIWGGEPDCEHEWVSSEKKWHSGTNAGKVQVGDRGAFHNDMIDKTNTCSLCGAWKGAYGLEPTPELYVEHTIEILREIRRVLRKDGVVFWNIGDSYATHASGSKKTGHNFRSAEVAAEQGIGTIKRPFGKQIGLKEKDLCLIPFRVAIAAQEDGWWVRSVIIWSKPNPMPESVTDRPTESHEYILMLTKSGTSQYWTHLRKRGQRTQPKPDYIWTHKRTGLAVDYQPLSDRTFMRGGKKVKLWSIFWTRHNLWRGHDYYWDADAVREPVLPQTLERYRYPFDGSFTPGYAYPNEPREHPHGWKNLKVRGMKTKGQVELDGQEQHHGQDISPQVAGRNIRSVWEFPTQPFKDAHFAVFPEKLPELCIKAATPEAGCCSKCGAPWERVIEKDIEAQPGYGNMGAKGSKWMDEDKQSSGHRIQKNMNALRAAGRDHDNPFPQNKTLGWLPTCKCNADKSQSIVLDPFSGAGTTLWVAKKLGRKAIGFDTSEEYCELAVERIRQQVMM